MYEFKEEYVTGIASVDAEHKRLFEIADSITEVKSVCRCGKKAIVNARISEDGKIVTEGAQIEIGGNDKYESMCWGCWQNRIKEENK
jgi:thymidine kinase